MRALMNEQPPSMSTEPGAGDPTLIRRLLLFFAFVYAVEGLAQPDGLIAQPLSYYLKTSEGWTAAQITAFTSLLYIAWIIKPLYGLISDFVPLFGYRRKGYLVLANIAAVLGFVWATQLSAPSVLFFALAITAYAMAISSTLCGAVLVENGQRLRASSRFINQQWLWYNIAGMAAAIAGGQLVQHLLPQEALHGAAAIVAFTPVLIIAGALFLVPERKVSINIQAMKNSFASLKSSLKRRELWLIAGFLVFVQFQPWLEHAALFHHDRHPEIFPKLYRYLVFDFGFGLDRWRLALSAPFWRLELKAIAERQHRRRRIHNGRVPVSLKRDFGCPYLFWRWFWWNARHGRHADTRRRLLPAWGRRLHLCRAHVRW